MRYKWIALVLLPWCVPAIPDEPYAFKELRFGMAVEAVKGNRPGLKCRDSKSPIGDVTCSAITPGETIAGVQLKTMLLGFHNDRLTSIFLVFDHNSFRIVTDALREKYGPPNSEENDAVQNRAGATFDNKKLVWKNATGDMMRASERFSKITESSVGFYSADYQRLFLERKAEDQKGRVKDL
jgi:hypothetical protein